jgi:hypothetical protein
MNQDQAAQFEQAINNRINAAVAAALAARPPPSQQQPAAVSTVAVKLPEFWTSDPIMWFRQAEACFRRSNITMSSTMYDHVLMKLPEAVVISVRNLINEIQPGANDAYERLKERLTDSYAKTRWQQAFALIKHPDLGNRRPSALMDEMLALLPTGAHSDDTIFLALFLLRLPTSMRDHPAAADHKTAADNGPPHRHHLGLQGRRVSCRRHRRSRQGRSGPFAHPRLSPPLSGSPPAGRPAATAMPDSGTGSPA